MPKEATSKKKTTSVKQKATTKVTKAKKATVAKKTAPKKAVTKKSAAKKTTAKRVAKKKTAPVSRKRTVSKAKKVNEKDLLVMQFAAQEEILAPPVPKMPPLPEPPRPMHEGICRSCQVLPAAAMELVIVLTCLVFSLSAVLLTSVQTIEQQHLIIQAQQDRHEYFVKR